MISPFYHWKKIFAGSSSISGDFRIEASKEVLRLVVGGYIQSVSVNYKNIKNTVWGNLADTCLSLCKNPKKILILGTAGQTVPLLILAKIPDVEITQVDYDPKVVNSFAKVLEDKLPNLKPNLARPKTIFEDAFDFVKNSKEKYNIVIVDLYTGGSFDKRFESEEFLKNLSLRISSQGWVIINRIFINNTILGIEEFSKKLRGAFSQVTSKRVKTKFWETSYNILFVCRI